MSQESHSEGKIIAKALTSLVDRARERGCKNPVIVIEQGRVIVREGGKDAVISSRIPVEFALS